MAFGGTLVSGLSLMSEFLIPWPVLIVNPSSPVTENMRMKRSEPMNNESVRLNMVLLRLWFFQPQVAWELLPRSVSNDWLAELRRKPTLPTPLLLRGWGQVSPSHSLDQPFNASVALDRLREDPVMDAEFHALSWLMLKPIWDCDFTNYTEPICFCPPVKLIYFLDWQKKKFYYITNCT